MQTFIAIQDALFGIKKGDVLKKINEELCELVNDSKIPKRFSFDPSVEPKFFRAIPQSKFIIGQEVCFAKEEICTTTSSRKRHSVKPFVAVKIHKIEFDSQQKIKILFNYGNQLLETTKENLLQIPEFYWFIDSKGKIHRDIVGRESKIVLNWRKASNNYFGTKEEAQAKILNLTRKLTS